MVYKFKHAETYKGLDPMAVGSELERIRVTNGGRLFTTDVVRAARPKNSPIHGAFTWDDAAAAEQHRLTEARRLLREVVVVYEQNQLPVSAFIHVRLPSIAEPQKTDMYYQAIQVAVNNPKEFESALADCITRLRAAEQSLEELRGLAKRGQRTKIRRAQTYVKSALDQIS